MTDKEFDNKAFKKDETIWYLYEPCKIEIVDFKTRKLGIRHNTGHFRFVSHDKVHLDSPLRTIKIPNI